MSYNKKISIKYINLYFIIINRKYKYNLFTPYNYKILYKYIYLSNIII